MAKKKRYFLGQSESSDWYVVDAAHRADFEKWVDECGDVEPPYATYVNSPSEVEFFLADAKS